MNQDDEGYRQREAMFDTARKIASDYPLFGTGARHTGSRLPALPQIHHRILARTIAQRLVGNSSDLWVAGERSDWAGVLNRAVTRYFLPGGVATGGRLVLLIWVALGGCLLHARWDFPLQSIPSCSCSCFTAPS